jgi:hypothetical protein
MPKGKYATIEFVAYLHVYTETIYMYISTGKLICQSIDIKNNIHNSLQGSC